MLNGRLRIDSQDDLSFKVPVARSDRDDLSADPGQVTHVPADL